MPLLHCLTPIHLHSEVFHPKEEVTWLGYGFIPNLASTAHFNRRLALAQGAFIIIKKLSPLGSVLMTLQTRCLVHSLLLPVVSYGVDLFVPNSAMAQRLDVLWHRALRLATNCFSSTQVTILMAEVALPTPTSLVQTQEQHRGLNDSLHPLTTMSCSHQTAD